MDTRHWRYFVFAVDYPKRAQPEGYIDSDTGLQPSLRRHSPVIGLCFWRRVDRVLSNSNSKTMHSKLKEPGTVTCRAFLFPSVWAQFCARWRKRMHDFSNENDTNLGWLGLAEMPNEQIDWQYLLGLDEGFVCISVTPNGPADQAGVQNCDFLRSINGIPWDTYRDTRPQVGTPAVLEIHRRGVGGLIVELLHEPHHGQTPACRRKLQAALCGTEVDHNDRLKWYECVLRHTKLPHLATRLAGLIAFKYWNRKTGNAFPSHATLSKDCNCGKSSVQRALSELYHHGFLRIFSGSKAGGSNRYRLSHPVLPTDGRIPKRRKS